MKNTYYTEIYPNLGLFRTKTRIKCFNIKKLKIHNFFHYLKSLINTKNNIKLGNLHECIQNSYPT